jgi:hypothetical protein
MKATIWFITSAWATLLLVSPVHSQVVVQAQIVTLQPQIGRDDTGFVSCGVRAIVMDSKIEFVEMHDFSLIVRADLFFGMLKSGKRRISKAEMLKGKFPTKAVMPAPVKFWISKENEGKPISPLKIMQSYDPGYILESADLVGTFAGIVAIIQGERMQFATRYKNESFDTVISFSAKMPEEEFVPLVTCLKGVTDRLSETSK